MIEKAYAKVVGNYLKTGMGGFIDNGIRVLTGNPTFGYSLSGSITLATTF